MLYFMQRKHKKAIDLIPPSDPKNIYKYIKEKFGHFLLSIMTIQQVRQFLFLSWATLSPNYTILLVILVKVHITRH